MLTLQDRWPRGCRRPCDGASHFSWFGGYGAEIRPIDDFGSAVAFDAAFNGEQGVGIGFQPAASRLAKKNGMHPVR